MQTKDSVRAKNYFFSVENVEYGAYMVHGFSKQKLQELSNGKKFADDIDQIQEDFESADLVVAHNVAFDIMFLRREFERLNRVFRAKEEFCTMKNLIPVCKIPKNRGQGYKYPKLSEACEFFRITDTEIKEDVKRFFGKDVGFHDARFDTTALYLIANVAMEKELEEIRKYL
jgi:DNA polymerase-3 subunit epsilon